LEIWTGGRVEGSHYIEALNLADRLSLLNAVVHIGCLISDVFKNLLTLLYKLNSASGVGFGCLSISMNFYDLTPDAGQTWLTWSTSSSVNFLDDQTGWRLYLSANNLPNQLLQTSDGGNTLLTIMLVSWQNGQFDFVDQQTCWATVISWDASTLLITKDRGKTWNEIRSVVVASPTPALHLILTKINIFNRNGGCARLNILMAALFNCIPLMTAKT